MNKIKINIKEGLTQKIMGDLSQVSNSTISRYISANKILPIDNGSKRNLRYSVKNVRHIIRETSPLHFKNKKKRQAFCNFKSATGKTSICLQISSHLAMMGYNILVIDTDPQASLSMSLGILKENNLTLYDLIYSNQNAEKVIKNIYPGLDCIPSNLSIITLEKELMDMPQYEKRITMTLDLLEKQYDFIFLDTSPTISSLNRNILHFSDVVNIVCDDHLYNLNSLKLLIKDFDKFSYGKRIENKCLNIISNKYEAKNNSSEAVMLMLKSHYSDFFIEDFTVRKSEDIIASSKIWKPLAFFSKRTSKGLKDIIKIVHYIAKN